MERKCQNPPATPSVEEQIEFYDKWNLDSRTIDFDDVDIKVRTRANEVLIWLSQLERNDLKILEVGCGTGWLTEKLTQFGKVVAIDLSPAAIKVAESRGTGACFVAGNFLEHDFDGAEFDVIVCVETLFYVEDQDRLLKRSADLLRESGWFAATTINKFVYDRSSAVGNREKGQIRQWLSRRTLKRLVSSYFELTSFFTVLPEGDKGLLRVTNSHRLNALLKFLISPESIKRLKEKIGLGGGVVILARRRQAE